MRKVFAGFVCAVLILVVIGFSLDFNFSKEREAGEARKRGTGRSFKKETFVARTPFASLAAPGWDSERVWSGEDDWEPAIAADPSSNYVYQMTTRYTGPKPCKGCPLPAIIFRSSSDGGATWGPDRFIPVTKNPQNDPMIEVATDGVIYAAWLDAYVPGVKFMKSSNRGVTWSTPIQFTNRQTTPKFSDRPVLAISKNGQHVYIAFNASDSYVVSSHNFGASFSAPVRTNNDTRYWFQTGGAVANDGTVYFVTSDFSQDYSGDANIRVIKSTDGGASWITTLVDTSREQADCPWAAGCYFGFFGASPALAVDGNGLVMVSYSANNTPGAPQKLWVRTSTNGINWSARSEVSNGSSNVNNAFPALATGNTSGDFRLVWQDDRNGFTTDFNTWYRRTTNGGNTWSTAVRLSDLGSGAPYKSTNGYRFPYGDYFELAVDSSGRNHVIWGEGLSWTGPGGTWYTKGQ